MPIKERNFRLKAVILRHFDWGEADRLITLFSLEEGKQRAVAKGVRKLRSRKSGHLEPFSQVQLLLARGRDLPIITQVETIESFSALREDLTLLGYASYIIELVERFTIEEEANREVYYLLVHTLQHLEQKTDALFELRYFDLKFLELIGFRPELNECVVCREKILPQDQYFALELGGVVCPNCHGKGTVGDAVSMEALKYLRHLQRSSYPEARRARIPQQIQNEMERLLQKYYTHLLERRLNTPQFIR
ncbi:MAG: DNA repair protein RecO, partial [Anaerolineales bacterium]